MRTMMALCSLRQSWIHRLAIRTPIWHCHWPGKRDSRRCGAPGQPFKKSSTRANASANATQISGLRRSGRMPWAGVVEGSPWYWLRARIAGRGGVAAEFHPLAPGLPTALAAHVPAPKALQCSERALAPEWIDPPAPALPPPLAAPTRAPEALRCPERALAPGWINLPAPALPPPCAALTAISACDGLQPSKAQELSAPACTPPPRAQRAPTPAPVPGAR
jgi:hypothetical protein